MATDGQRPYRGRFAPSPTGPLHFGSLVAAVGSFIDARAHDGEWLVRIENLDPPREVAGAADAILHTLDAFGLHWDGEIVYQSQRTDLYEQALQKLENAGSVYPCACSRRDILQLSAQTSSPQVYPGTCRHGLPPGREARSIRLLVPELAVRFSDRLQGDIQEWLPESSGDFIVKRADGLFAYQLAVVVDDISQGITDVVRGVDLLDSTGRQLLVQQLLGAAAPRYLHLPVATNKRGVKLSKQTKAMPIDSHQKPAALCAALRFLGQPIPAELEAVGLEELWHWAIANWDTEKLPTERQIPVP
jgi:glutamyl-Q tRNA(Asp) synthetase